MATQIQIRRDTALNWTNYNPTLAAGELGYDSTNEAVKIGDGTTAWNSLGYFPVTLDSLTAGSGLSVDLVPDADLTRSIGTSTLRFADIFGDLDGAVKIYARAGEALSQGDVVYISGLHVPTGLTEVSKANASDVNKMPAFGIAQESVSSGDELHVVTFGELNDTNLAGYTEGDSLYVSATTDGEFTDAAPTGEGNLVQKIGQVLKGGNGGTLRVAGAGRTNATPNLNDGNIFIGNSSNQAVTTSLATEIANNPTGVTNLTAATTTTDTGGVIVTGTAPGAFTVAHQAKPTTVLSTSGNITSIGIDALGHIAQINTAADLPTWRSTFDVPSVEESNLYKMRPTSNTEVVKLFDDMMGFGNMGFYGGSPFYSVGILSGRFEDTYGEYDGETGVGRFKPTAAAGRVGFYGPQVLEGSAPLGDEWLFETRAYLNINTSDSNNVAKISLSAFCPTTNVNTASIGPHNTSASLSKCGISLKVGDTYWKEYLYDNEGVGGNVLEQDLTSYTVGAGWKRLGIHCKRVLGLPNAWRCRFYIDGSVVSTKQISSGTLAPTFFFGLYNNNYNATNSLDVDWLSFQYTRPTSVTSIQIEDLT